MSLILNCAEKESESERASNRERERERERNACMGRFKLGLGTWGVELGERRIVGCIPIWHP